MTYAQTYLKWVTSLQAMAQNGLNYSKNPYDIERFHQLQAIAAEMAANISEAPPEKIQALFTEEKGHATPKLDVRGVVFDSEHKILLVKESADGLWTLPGGWVDVNEPPSGSVSREVFEESGFTVRPVKLLALYDKQKHPHPPQWPHIYKLFFRCEIIEGEPKTSIETLDVKFFSKDNLPDLSTPRVTKEQIYRFYEHLAHPDWPTDFD